MAAAAATAAEDEAVEVDPRGEGESDGRDELMVEPVEAGILSVMWFEKEGSLSERGTEKAKVLNPPLFKSS
jgi:hypothetical protein